MKAAGMVPLTLNAADMKALVSYVSSLGGASASSAATSSASGSSSPALTKEESEGATIFKAHGCAGCHGVNGAGGTAAAPALAGTTLTPALLTTMLQHPTAAMQRGGMPPQSLTGGDLKALVAYVSSISASKSKTR
jgi:mono/diheme cytochrome c family protein